jgi:Protein of unknown function (DUF3105)
MNKKRIQERRKSHSPNKRISRLLIWGGIGIAVIAVVVVLILNSNPTAQAAPPVQEMNQVVQIPIASRNHIPIGTPPPIYNSDPPAGGDHYPETMPTKFYKESDLASLPQYPLGYLVHNLEHGYVIFWYNCQVYQGTCDDLMQKIQQVMSQFGGVKVVAFPWHTISVPLVLTSWGRLLRLSTPDQTLMTQFVQTYRFQAPEPNSP